MHKTVDEALAFIQTIKAAPLKGDVDAVICAPYLSLPFLVREVEGTRIEIGAQNVHFELQGAYTGEISVPMLKAVGVKYVIIGHSERRQYFNETDETVNLKVKAAHAGGLIPIVCVGESLEERESGRTNDVVANQVSLGLDGLTLEEMKDTIIAYEPVWAIGTGKAATAKDAEETIAWIRRTLAKLFGKEVASEVRILYGGSVKPDNIRSFMEQPNIDGALVGGASLDADSFIKLVHEASEGDHS